MRYIRVLAFLAVLPAVSFASPFEEVTPKEELYQRVRNLSQWNLLDAQDAAVLDRGETVTRLQLAFYTEKAKARLSTPQLPEPQPVARPAEMPPLEVPSAPVMEAPMALPEAPLMDMSALPAPGEPLPVNAPPAAAGEVDALLKALKEESLYLRTRLDLMNKDVEAREKETARIAEAMAGPEGVLKKANKQSSSPNFNTNSRTKFEDFTLKSAAPASLATGSKLPNQRVTTWGQDFYFGMWADIGKGSITDGFGGYLPYDNGDTSAVSMYMGRPKVDMNFDTRVGKVNLQFLEEAYTADTTLGDFTRGVEPEIPKRFDRPYHIKPWSDDKNLKIWDDYIRSLGFVETKSLVGGSVQSTSDRVFDGVVFKVSDMPYVGPQTKATVILGRMLVREWFEYAVRVNRPWLKNDRLGTTFSAIWVDNTSGVKAVSPDMDLRCYEGVVSIDLAPLFLTFDGAMSRLYTGYWDPDGDGIRDEDGDGLIDPAPNLLGYAGRATASVYPLNFTLQNITPDYSNFQSKVSLTAVNFSNMGWASKNLDGSKDRYGEIAEATTPQSNRHGWLANFGWNGRREEWMKEKLPKILDYLVLNVDLANRTEYRAIHDNSGHYLIEPWQFVTFYYPEDEGVWGDHMWGGFGGTAKPVRDAYMNNILAGRAEPVTLPGGAVTTMNNISEAEIVRYRFRQPTERIPMVDPTTLEKLSHIKSYKYLAFTNKWQVNQLAGLSKPLYLGFHIGSNTVSGKAVDDTQSDIATMFKQDVWDVHVLFGRVLPYVNLMGHVSRETWKSDYSYPRVDSKTDNYGFGMAYDVPWGGGKVEARYENVKFRSATVPANDYDGDQVYAYMKVLF